MDIKDKMRQRVERQMELLYKEPFTSETNLKVIKKYYRYCKARVSDARIAMTLDKLKYSCKIVGKDFKDWEESDLIKIIAKMREEEKSLNTIDTLKSILITFLRWYHNTDVTPKFARRVLKRKRVPTKIQKSQLLRPEEIEKLILATDNVMWQGLIAAFTSGGRPNEIHNVRLRDVEDKGDMISIKLGVEAGKKSETDTLRTSFVYRFAKYLRKWLDYHPLRHDPDAWLWVNGGNEKLHYDRMCHIIKKCADKANLDSARKVNPYVFRHVHGTYAYVKVGYMVGRKTMGHSASSKMSDVYVHMDDADLANELRGEKRKEQFEFDLGVAESLEEKYENARNKNNEKELLEFLKANSGAILEMYKKWVEK